MPAPVKPLLDDDALCAGGRLVSVEGQVLPLGGARLAVTAAGGVAEVVLEQRFKNHHPVPLTVVYDFALPAEAAVSGYAFTVGDRRIVGEIDRRTAARERFERALAEGKTAGLVEQDRSSLFRQELGNIPPGAEVVATLTLEQRLRWLEEGRWEWRFPTTVAPRYQGQAAGAATSGERGVVEVADGPLPARLELALEIRDRGRGAVESPSHHVRATGAGGAVAFEAAGGVPLDRDVVVRWAVERAAVGVSLEVARAVGGESAHGLLTIVPPPSRAEGANVPRDLIVLLDTSGSMGGEPLDQARRVVGALVDTLGERDRLEMIEFSRAPRRWRAEPVAATPEVRREALAWLAGLRAEGGTEMRAGIDEALRPLRPDSQPGASEASEPGCSVPVRQRQVVVVTDGLIGFETEVVGAIIRDLPPSSRLHTVGVGSAVNRSLTGPAARAGRGAEVVVGLGEDGERAARRLVARTDAPQVVDLTISGSALVAHAPRRLPDLFAGAPVLVGLALRPEGGTLVVEGRTATSRWSNTVEVPATAPGQGRRTIQQLHGREQVEDLEMRIAGGEDPAALDPEIERIGLAFGLSTRLTSWVAVSEEPSTKPGEPTRRVRLPQELPAGMSIEGLGLRGMTIAAAGAPMQTFALASMPMPRGPTAGPPPGYARRMSFGPRAKAGDQPTPPPSPVMAPPRGGLHRGGPATERRFRGRIVRREGRELEVHFRVEGPDLLWLIGAHVEVVGTDGRRRVADVTNASDRGATVSAGQEIRLVITLPAADSPAPLQVVVADGPELVVIVL